MQTRLASLPLLLALAFACGDKGDTGSRGGSDAVDADGDGIFEDNDCNDQDATIYPGADELCDGVDNDCDDEVDEDAVDAATWYGDRDGDGFGAPDVQAEACAAPTGMVDNGDDCDDDDADVSPDAAEVCNDIDDDCDGLVDDADDGLDASTGGTFYVDVDADGYGDAANPTEACAAPSGYRLNRVDCDDPNADVNPGAAEVCNDIDDDCDGLVDDADDSVDPSTARDWYADTDADGYGDPTNTTLSCALPSGHVEDDTDCDDTDAAIHPAATEICDDADTDEDCNGVADDADGAVDGATRTLWYPDADTDGYGDLHDSGTPYCDDPSDGSNTWRTDHTDCDDADGAIHPAATEVCDDADTDEDCDGDADDADASVDATTRTLWYPDGDNDGYGDDSDAGTRYCDDPSDSSATWRTDHTDCDDADSAISPAATEICDAADTDEDCDGDADDADSSVDRSTGSLWYPDADTDGYGDHSDAGTLYCDDPSAGAEVWLSDNTDCLDDNSDVHPGAAEICDGLDTDCDSTTSDDGRVTWTDDATGASTDVTSAWAAGTAGAPATITATTDGVYTVCDGTFTVNIAVEAAAVSFETPNGSSATVLDGDAADPVLSVDANSSVTLGGLTLRNGAATHGGGLFVEGTLYGTDVVLTGNEATTYGGGVYVSGAGAEVVLEDCTLELNTAPRGAGGFTTDSASLAVSNCTVSDNTSTNWGGGLEVYDSATLTVSDSTLSDNTAAYYGGGIECNSDGVIVIDDSDITDNTATVSDGGGIDLWSCDLEITDSVLDGNTAGDEGGNLFVYEDATVLGDGAEFAAGTASKGGGIAAFGEVDLTDVDIYGNSATTYGGGVYVSLGSVTVSFTNADFSGNVRGSLYNAGDATVYAYGLGETFTCDSSACY